MNRFFLSILLLLAGCTRDNPDYCGPRGWIDCKQAYIYVYPDMTGFQVVPLPDMTVPPDLADPPPPDLLPEYLAHLGEPCDGGAPDPHLYCLYGRLCGNAGAMCTAGNQRDCCATVTDYPNFACRGYSKTMVGRCCAGGGSYCLADSECCGDGDAVRCVAGRCSR